MMRYFFSLLLVFVSVCISFSNPLDSIGVTKINDKLHVKYMVSPGETIYGISTKYGVSVADLLEINPELENGLKVGQVINIPYYPELVKTQKKDDNIIYHKVQPGETLYSLSKKYNVPVNDLLKMNGMELKAGQDIAVGYKDKQKVTQNNQQNNQTTQNNTTQNNQTTNNTTTDKVVKVPDNSSNYVYPYDPYRKQVLIIPFDPYLYFSDADDEIAAKSNMPRTKVRQVFRRRLNALLDHPAYETIHLLGGKTKDSLSDLNKIYSSVTYNYQEIIKNPNYPNEDPQDKEDKTWIDKQKDKIKNIGTGTDTRYNLPKDHGKYFGVIIKNPDFFTYFNNKYSVDYYVFINQFEVKTDYENCLDRAALNFERSFTTHFSIFDSTGTQIAGNKFKTHYNSNSNYVYQIVADNIPKIAERILAELPSPK